MSYTPNFINPYPNGWKDLPNETTPINASALQAHTDAIVADEQYLQSLDATVDGKVSVQGFAKTWSARTWNKGEILYDGGKTYIANTNTAQRPPHADWTQTNLGDEVSAINMSLANTQSNLLDNIDSLLGLNSGYTPKTDVDTFYHGIAVFSNASHQGTLPSSSSWQLVMALRFFGNSQPAFSTQLCFDLFTSATNKIYMRQCYNGTWSAWKSVTFS